ncbi:hypothetical protein PVAND_017255 [Polypedilum vanderplanki]|uniref:Leucine rich repeat protein n=1 Tax=Polypedilum vanderplanki TaxID=319348 RepID=A0A9J6BI61_POLVA|nr:hypothetical protein PVAND_017255 [Polypedilum vanderplanki]
MKSFCLLLLILTIFLIDLTESNNLYQQKFDNEKDQATINLIDGEMTEGSCFQYLQCENENEKKLKQFKVNENTKILTNDAKIMQKHKSNEIEWFEIYFVITMEIFYFPINVNEIFPNLLVFYVSNTKIKMLNYENFKDMKKLLELTLSYNQIEEINEDTFDDLQELKILDLRGNKLKILNSRTFNNISNLKVLSLQENEISSIMGQFGNLKNLSTLDLYENQLVSIPSNIFENLSNLQFLDLSKNKLTNLPNEIFEKISNLKYLELYRNQLQTLDENIFKNNHKLDGIDLSFNKITKLSFKIFEEKIILYYVNLERNLCTNLLLGEYLYDDNVNPLTDEDKNKLKNELEKNCS